MATRVLLSQGSLHRAWGGVADFKLEIMDFRLFFGVHFFIESNLLLKGKLIFRFPASSFAHLAARGRALLTEMAIWARMFLRPSSAARLVEKTLILG
jgi:hypothetical protein